MLYRKLAFAIAVASMANVALWQWHSVVSGASEQTVTTAPKIILEVAQAQIPSIETAPPLLLNTPEVPQAQPATTKKSKLAKITAPNVSASNTPISHWGVMIRPYGLKTGNQLFTVDQLTIQLDLAKELGATDVRANVEELMATNDAFVDESIARGLEPTLILEAPPKSFDTDTYKQAYEFGKLYAARYKGRVHYYQLSNEASGMAIRPGYSGKDFADYDANRYHNTLDIMRGLGEGVQSADSGAKRIISANWMGTGVIDRLVADEVGFEIIGWNWYSDMGEDLIKQLPDGTFNIPKYLSKYNKQFWMVEANRADGTQDSNFSAQANYLENLTKNVTSHHNMQGFFVFGLTDQCGESSKPIGHMGLVKINSSDSGLCTIGDKKPAFDIFKSAISKYSK